MLARTNKLIVSPTFYEHVICYPVTFINKWVRGAAAAVSAPGSLELLFFHLSSILIMVSRVDSPGTQKKGTTDFKKRQKLRGTFPS